MMLLWVLCVMLLSTCSISQLLTLSILTIYEIASIQTISVNVVVSTVGESS